MSDIKQARIADWLGQQLVHRIELEGMITANQERRDRGEAQAYPSSAFTELRNEVALSNDYHMSAVRDAE